MTGQDLVASAPAWFFVLPAVVVWLVVLSDIATRQGLTGRARLAWAVAVTAFFPTALVWLLLRPTGDPLSRSVARLDEADPRVRLAELVVRHDRGEIADADFARERDALFGRR